jgi:hypothetical protein
MMTASTIPTTSVARIRALQERGLDLVCGGVLIDGNPWVVDYFDNTKLIHMDDCVLAGTLFGRRSVFRRYPFLAVEYGEDTEFWERASKMYRSLRMIEPRYYLLSPSNGGMRDSFLNKSGLLAGKR